MENRFQAAYIPRQSGVSGDSYTRPKSPPNFFMMIGVLVFVLAIAAIAGLYFYASFLVKSNEAKKTQIQEEINNFEPELTQNLSIIKARMDAGKTLLSGHKAFTLLFFLLEKNTAQTVRFTEFSYEIDSSKKILLDMRGEARTYNAIAYQSDIFSKVEEFKNPVFSDISLNEQGIIIFNVTAELNPNSVAYKNLIVGTSTEGSAGTNNSSSATGPTPPATSGATSTPVQTGAGAGVGSASTTPR